MTNKKRYVKAYMIYATEKNVLGGQFISRNFGSILILKRSCISRHLAVVDFEHEV